MPVPHSFASINLHIVFSVKERARLLVGPIAERLHPYLGGIARARACSPLAVGGTSDHVHLLIGLSRDLSPAELIRDLKANSSKWIRQTYPDLSQFAWQGGYGVFSVSQSNVDDVRRYIERQEEHHRARSFQDEFRVLLERHGIELDERYMWE
jgi:REP element-mobilizing transposase RayT